MIGSARIISITNALFDLFYFGAFVGTRRSSRGGSSFGRRTYPRRIHHSPSCHFSQRGEEPLLVIVGGGAAGVYAAIRAKSVAPHLSVVVLEKGKFLSKVRISGGGRCNVTNGHYVDKMALAEHYPRGSKELRGSFFSMHGPLDTISWFSDNGVELKIEDDGRVFPVSNNSTSVTDCLLTKAKRSGVLLQAGKAVTSASKIKNGKFYLKIEKRTMDFVEHIDADYLLISTGSSPQGYNIASQLGHSIIDPVPSLFTFKVDDDKLADLSGVTFPKVKAILKLQNTGKNAHLVQVGSLLVTHWGLSGPVILRLSAWGARELFGSDYTGMLDVDFVPDMSVEEVRSTLFQSKDQLGRQKVFNSYPPEFGVVKRFWKYLLERENIDGNTLWASMSNASLNSIALLIKQCLFRVDGKGRFKDEFVTAGGVPLSEISLNTMESKIVPQLFFAGEVLNIDGVTGGFNLQSAWSGGYIAGTRIGKLALDACIDDEGKL